VIADVIARAWSLGAGPGSAPMVMDLDSTVCEVYGKKKQGAAYGYTKVLGYHPLVAVRADSGEVLHARLRKGSSLRGNVRFAEELVARVRRAGATRSLVVRGDAGFFSWALLDTFIRLRVAFSVTVSMKVQIKAAIEAIDEAAWVPITYPAGGEAQVAEIPYVSAAAAKRGCRLRLVVRRSRLIDPFQAQLWPNWRYNAFVTDMDLALEEMDRFHREHATVELAIRDLKEGAGLEHCPSGRFFANAAWLGCAVLAHNLVRWTALLGGIHPAGKLTVARTVRNRLFSVPGRLVNRSGRPVVRLPERWPWAATFSAALRRLRALPMLT
jgi:hypothetical protein